MQTQKVRVLRAFYYDRKLLNPGEEHVLPKLHSLEFRAANKVEFVEEAPAPPAPEQAVTEPEDEPARKRSRGKE